MTSPLRRSGDICVLVASFFQESFYVPAPPLPVFLVLSLLSLVSKCRPKATGTGLRRLPKCISKNLADNRRTSLAHPTCAIFALSTFRATLRFAHFYLSRFFYEVRRNRSMGMDGARAKMGRDVHLCCGRSLCAFSQSSPPLVRSLCPLLSRMRPEVPPKW